MDTDKAPDEQLFDLARLRGDARAPILSDFYVKVAARMLLKEPERYARLLGIMAGWHSLSVFKSKVQKIKADAEAKRKEHQAAQEAAERLADAEARGLPFIAMGKPVQIARDFIAQRMPHLIHYGGDFLDYEVNAYRRIEKPTIRAMVQAWMENGVDAGTGEPVHPNKTDVDYVMDALSSVVHRDGDAEAPPVWLDYWPEVDPDPKMTLSARNGLVDVGTGMFLPPDPRFFTLNGLPFDYIPDAPPPVAWFQFLESIWPGEEGRVNHDALQEIMGHVLTPQTKYQKIFMLVGPPRAGKGTITRMMSSLCGMANVASMSAGDLARDFGLAPLVGKQLLIVPDLRLSRADNIGRVVEILLNISGEDSVLVNRKYRDQATTRLNTRIVIATNREVVLPDQTGALASRYVPLVFHKSFINNPDRELDAKLAPELPGIFNWALEGLRRLEARRDAQGLQSGFQMTPNGAAMLAEISRRGSPVKTFIAECCDLDPTGTVKRSKLFDVFQSWCKENELASTFLPETFSKELRTASGYNVELVRMRDDEGKRTRVYAGVRLKPEFEEFEWSFGTEDFDDD